MKSCKKFFKDLSISINPCWKIQGRWSPKLSDYASIERGLEVLDGLLKVRCDFPICINEGSVIGACGSGGIPHLIDCLINPVYHNDKSYRSGKGGIIVIDAKHPMPLDTISLMAKVGLKGLVLKGDCSPDNTTIADANRHGIFIVCVD